MTFSDEEFVTVDDGFDDVPDYPVAFGITFTPQVSGVACAVLGLAAAAYILMNFVQPVWQEYQELRSNIDEKEAQIQQQQAIQQRVQQLETELTEAQARQSQVLALFANERNLDTLLLDLNRSVEARQGQLVNFTPQGEVAQVTDGSLGSAVDGKLKRQSINVEVRGTFDQTQSIMRSLEQLQSLLLIRDFISRSNEDQTATYANGNVLLPETPTLTTTFRLDALVPLTEQERDAVVPPEETTEEAPQE